MDVDELVGLWHSAPYDYGSMEASELALLSDGTGWGTVANAAGGISLTLLTWRRLGADVLELRETAVISGTWQVDRPDQLRADEPPVPLDEVTRVRYELVHETPPLATSPTKAVRFDSPLLFAHSYAFIRSGITVADRPTVEPLAGHQPPPPVG